MSEARDEQLDRIAEAFSDMATALTPNLAEAAALLSQASMITALRFITPMQFAEAQLQNAKDTCASIRARTQGTM
jgi:hydroxymethylpyrimidine/phosphomethylpyrimidine kinase